MIKIKKNLNLDVPDTLEDIYKIKFTFTSGNFKSRNLQNIIAWDTESSSGYRVPDSKKVIGFDQEKYDRGVLKTHDRPHNQIDYSDKDVQYMQLLDSCEPVGIIYMYTVCIEDGHGGIYKYLGRDFNDYLNFQIKLIQEIKRQAVYGYESVDREYENRKVNKMKLNINMWVHTHNLGHDWQFLRSLHNDLFDNSRHSRVFARKSRKPMKATMRLNGVNIIYKDTLSLVGVSLANWAKDCPNIPIEKQKDFDYLTIKTPKDKLEPLEVKYGIYDTAIIVYGMEYERKLAGGKLEDVPLTMTSKVRRVLEKKVCRRLPWWAYNCAFITRSYSPEEYRKRIALYTGGYCHGCASHVGEVGDVHMYDFCSSYPSSLCTAYYACEGYEECSVDEFEELEKQDVERPEYR